MPFETILYGHVVGGTINTVVYRDMGGQSYCLYVPTVLRDHPRLASGEVSLRVSLNSIISTSPIDGDILEVMPWQNTDIITAVSNLAVASGSNAWNVSDVVAEMDRIRDDEGGL